MSYVYEPPEGKFLFKRRYPALDLFRAIAIIMVVANHFDSFIGVVPFDTTLKSLLKIGMRGVPLFFVLSGFLIGGQILEELLAKRFSFKKFYVKRFWRIFPPYYVSLLVVMALYFTGLAARIVVMPGTSQAELLKDVFYHFLYLQNFTGAKIQTNIYWTLGIEEQFYIIAPLALLILYKKCAEHLGKILIAMICLGIALQVILNFSTMDFRWYRPWFSINFYYLIIGVSASYIFIKYHERLINASKLFKTIVFLIPMLFFIIAILWKKELTLFKVSIYTPFIGLGLGTLILSSVITPFDRLIPLKKVFSYIAKLSYTMYLYHVILFVPFTRLYIKVMPIKTTGHFLLALSFYFICLIIISRIIYFLIDRPCMNIRRREIARWNDN